MIVTFIKTTTQYFWLKFKTFLKKPPVMTKNTLAQTINSFIQIYNLYKYSSNKTCG